VFGGASINPNTQENRRAIWEHVPAGKPSSDALPSQRSPTVASGCEQVELVLGKYSLRARGGDSPRFIFPTDSFISLMTQSWVWQLGGGTVGSEGMYGIPLMLRGGDVSPLPCRGAGLRLCMANGAERFHRELEHSVCTATGAEPLHLCVDEPTGANSRLHPFHVVESGLARWLR